MTWHVGLFVEWALALGWLSKTVGAVRGLPTVERLDSPKWDVWPERLPGLTVIVPGRDEGAHIRATLESLVAQDYSTLQVLAVDDRSNDATGAMMDEFARSFPARLSVLHVTDLPEGWLGKVHALAEGLRVSEPHAIAEPMPLDMEVPVHEPGSEDQDLGHPDDPAPAVGSESRKSASEYVLFTDADVRFAPSLLRRAVAYAARERLDHLVVMPTMELRSWNEGILLGVFHTFILWAARPWKVPDARAKRDVIGVGAFNLVRRSALKKIGGLAPQAMVVIEDITIARRMKSAGLRTRVAFAPGMVRVHWAKGIRGQMGVMGKNLFSAFNFALLPALAASVGMAVLGLAPLLGLFWWQTAIPALLMIGCVVVMYRICKGFSMIPATYAWTYPLGALLFSWTILRSVAVVLRAGGVHWRGTLYPLKELREHNSPWRWDV